MSLPDFSFVRENSIIRHFVPERAANPGEAACRSSNEPVGRHLCAPMGFRRPSALPKGILKNNFEPEDFTVDLIERPSGRKRNPL